MTHPDMPDTTRHFHPPSPELHFSEAHVLFDKPLDQRVVDGLANEIAGVRRENEEITRQLHEAHEANRRLRRRLATALKAAQVHSDVETTLDSSTHAVLADRFRDLLTQDVQHLVREHQRDGLGRMTPLRIAQEIHTLCRYLFLDGYGDTTALCMRMGMDPERHGVAVQELIDKVTALRSQAHGVYWDMEATPDRRLDPERQQPWGQCDPEADVDFVIAPAYCVNGRLYAKQQVFTKQRWSWRL